MGETKERERERERELQRRRGKTDREKLYLKEKKNSFQPDFECVDFLAAAAAKKKYKTRERNFVEYVFLMWATNFTYNGV